MSRTAHLLLLICIARASASAQPPQPAGDPPGTLIDIGGRKLHILCTGPASATPTVILEAGGGGSSKDWTAVRNLLPAHLRVCAYDRAGLGFSEKGPAPRTMRQEVFELHALLEAAKIPGPYVLVGQSIGGLLVRLYLEKYPRDVAGMVLVDGTNESSVLFNLKMNKWVRLRDLATGRTIPEPRREGKPSEGYKPEDDYMAEEFQQFHLAREASPQPLGDRPLIVLGAGKRPAPPGVSAEMWTDMRREKDEQAEGLARLSRNSRFILDPASGHHIHADNPKLVAQSIEEVVQAAVKKKALER